METPVLSPPLVDVWRSATTTCGAQSVTILLVSVRQWSSADSWDTALLVSSSGGRVAIGYSTTPW